MNTRLAGRIAVVAGSAEQLGDAALLALAQEGAHVVRAPDGAASERFLDGFIAQHRRVDALLVSSPVDVSVWLAPAAERMASTGGGSIVSVVSLRALAGDVDGRDDAVAGATAIALSRALATEFGRSNVRCNCVAIPPADLPGGVGQSSAVLPWTPAPEDVANVAVFLLSDDAAFVTGQVVRCDSGMLSHLPHYAQLRRLRTATVGGDAQGR